MSTLSAILHGNFRPNNTDGMSIRTKSLSDFVLTEKSSLKYVWIALIGTTIQYVVFKLFYPYPDFISDSYSYIATNLYHLDVNLWPVGYSKFIAILHKISYSDNFLTWCQYFILEASLAYFYFSFLYLFNPSRLAKNILFIFLFFNPLFLYIANCVLSDALFTSLTLVWFTQLLWMFHTPKRYQVIIIAVLIGILFTLRYTAVYYPVVTAFAFILSRFKRKIKITGIIAPLLFMIPFYIYTQHKTKEVTGTAEFSVFGGWQIANNALYMYDYIHVDSSKLPSQFRPLDRMVKEYFTTMHPGFSLLSPFPGTYFIKVSSAPLKQYMFKHVESKDGNWTFREWGKVSPLYNAYGTYLIKHYPLSFAQYYLILNAKNYFIPHLEKFGSYNIGSYQVWQEAKAWFHYDSPDIAAISMTLQGDIFFVYPTLFLLLNFYFSVCLIRFLKSRGIKSSDPLLVGTILVSTVFLLVNFAFSVFATPVVLRYQIFPMILLLAVIMLLTRALRKTRNENITNH